MGVQGAKYTGMEESTFALEVAAEVAKGLVSGCVEFQEEARPLDVAGCSKTGMGWEKQ